MAVLWRLIIGALLSWGASFLARLLVGFGVFAVTAAISQTVITQVTNAIMAKLNGIGMVAGVNVAGILQYAGVFDFVSIILAAYTAAFAVKVLKAQAAAAINAANAAATSANSSMGSGSSGGSSGGSAGGAT